MKNYLVCSNQRSGSTLLCDALTATDIAGQPREYFLPKGSASWKKALELSPSISPLEYLRALQEKTATSNGVFSAKVMASYMMNWVKGLALETETFKEIDTELVLPNNSPTIIKLLSSLLPDLGFIWLTRRDKIRQGVSCLIARQTMVWSVKTGRSLKQPLKTELTFDFEELDRYVTSFEFYEKWWGVFFEQASVDFVHIYYEDFLQDQEGTIYNALDALGLKSQSRVFKRPISNVSQSSELNREWAERYKHLKQKQLAEVA